LGVLRILILALCLLAVLLPVAFVVIAFVVASGLAVATFAHREARFAIQPVALLALSQFRAPPAARLR